MHLAIAPPPDLALEIDVTSRTHTAIYETLQVPELWRFKKGRLQINLLQEGKYIEAEFSFNFPALPLKEVVPQYLQQAKRSGRNKAIKDFRGWVRKQKNL